MNKLKAVLGITNKTEDDKYVPFLDFDNIDYPNLILSLCKIQKDLQLSVAFIIKSTNGYNAFFLDKLTFVGCLYLCKKCPGIDPNFIVYAEKKRNFTLRLGNDKKFIGIVKSPYLTNELSYAHYAFFCEYFNTDILKYVDTSVGKFDSLSEIQLVRYMSKKYGYIEVD